MWRTPQPSSVRATAHPRVPATPHSVRHRCACTSMRLMWLPKFMQFAISPPPSGALPTLPPPPRQQPGGWNAAQGPARGKVTGGRTGAQQKAAAGGEGGQVQGGGGAPLHELEVEVHGALRQPHRVHRRRQVHLGRYFPRPTCMPFKLAERGPVVSRSECSFVDRCKIAGLGSSRGRAAAGIKGAGGSVWDANLCPSLPIADNTQPHLQAWDGRAQGRAPDAELPCRERRPPSPALLAPRPLRTSLQGDRRPPAAIASGLNHMAKKASLSPTLRLCRHQGVHLPGWPAATRPGAGWRRRPRSRRAAAGTPPAAAAASGRQLRATAGSLAQALEVTPSRRTHAVGCMMVYQPIVEAWSGGATLIASFGKLSAYNVA